MPEDHLKEFVEKHKIKGKGALSVMLVITRRAKDQGLPLDTQKQLTGRGGQVIGLGKPQVQAILKDYGITKVLAQEAGRTSRGSISNMKKYITFLNDLHTKGIGDLLRIEEWWIGKVRDYFAAHPFKLKMDRSKSLHSIISDLLKQARKRQQDVKGTTYTGTVMQHLVGAKLELALPKTSIVHHGASVADSSTKRHGDFIIGDSVIHVTTAPSEDLIQKCKENLDTDLRPIIITTKDGVVVALSLANDINIKERLDVLDVLQFVATNIYELSVFKQSSQPIKINELVKIYNKIIEDVETDPSLKIEIVH